jgi:hypothetical protein
LEAAFSPLFDVPIRRGRRAHFALMARPHPS